MSATGHIVFYEILEDGSEVKVHEQSNYVFKELVSSYITKGINWGSTIINTDMYSSIDFSNVRGYLSDCTDKYTHKRSVIKQLDDSYECKFLYRRNVDDPDTNTSSVNFIYTGLLTSETLKGAKSIFFKDTAGWRSSYRLISNIVFGDEFNVSPNTTYRYTYTLSFSYTPAEYDFDLILSDGTLLGTSIKCRRSYLGVNNGNNGQVSSENDGYIKLCVLYDENGTEIPDGYKYITANTVGLTLREQTERHPIPDENGVVTSSSYSFYLVDKPGKFSYDICITIQKEELDTIKISKISLCRSNVNESSIDIEFESPLVIQKDIFKFPVITISE